MFSLFAVFQRFGHFILFIVLELVSLYLVVNYNQSQKQIFIHSSSLLTGSILEKTSKLDEYVYLQNENQKLIQENTRLLQEILSLSSTSAQVSPSDSFYLPYEAIPAKVINQNIHTLRNYITLDKGAIQGVDRPLGIITNDGVVGIVKNIGKKYSSAMSLLHVDSRVSASLKNQNYFGTISWNGKNILKLSLEGIPKYATVNSGDSVVTNGYSTLFPKGVIVGIVTSHQFDKSGDFYDIEVTPAVNFGNLTNVYVIKNKDAQERIAVENEN